MKKLLPMAGSLALVLSLAACGGDDGAKTTGSGNSAAKAADCALVNAPDPGNAEPPAGVTNATDAPKLAKKDTYNVAFSQNAHNNPWRLAETASMKAEAEKLGYKLTVTDANNDQTKQIADIKGLIAQKPDVLFIAPITEQLGNVVKEAAAANIPVILLDRTVDPKVAVPGKHYVTTIASNFVREGERAAVAMAKATGGKGKIIELEGTTGSSPAIDRKKGFTDKIKECPGLQVVVAQSADFTRSEGQSVTETLLQSHPDATAVYAHNDEMAIGAIAAIKAAGKVPGKDIKVVSIDGEKDALKAIIKGDLYASVECSPAFGPKAFETMKAWAEGQPVPTQLVNEDRYFDAASAPAAVDTAF